jgi:hypothetical protein
MFYFEGMVVIYLRRLLRVVTALLGVALWRRAALVALLLMVVILAGHCCWLALESRSDSIEEG